MKLYITYIWFDIWASVCPDIAHGAFLNKEDAQKLALDNFNAYREAWKDMDDFEIKQESPDKYEIWVDHGFFTSYVEECELVVNDIDLNEIKDNNTLVYFMRPDVTVDKGLEKPYDIPYKAFTKEEEGQQYLNDWFNKFVEFAKDKPNFTIDDFSIDDKSVYCENYYAKFYLDETRLVTNLKDYLMEGKKNDS